MVKREMVMQFTWDSAFKFASLLIKKLKESV